MNSEMTGSDNGNREVMRLDDDIQSYMFVEKIALGREDCAYGMLRVAKLPAETLEGSPLLLKQSRLSRSLSSRKPNRNSECFPFDIPYSLIVVENKTGRLTYSSISKTIRSESESEVISAVCNILYEYGVIKKVLPLG